MKQEPQGQTAADPNRMLREAEAHAQAGRLDEAAQIYGELVRQCPRDPDLLNFLALVENRRSNTDKALSLLQTAVAVAPSRPEFRNDLGNLLRTKERLQEAETQHREAITLKPDYPEAHYNLGITLENGGRENEAMDAYAAAVKYKPDYAQAWVRIGALQILNERLTEALEAFDRAIAANPALFDAHCYSGWVLAQTGRFDESRAAYQRAAAISPSRIEMHAAQTRSLRDGGHIEEVLAAYRMALEIDPTRTDLHFEYASLCHTHARPDPFATFTAARARLGDNPDLLLAEAQLRFRRQEMEQVQELLTRATAVAPDRADIAAFFGSVLADQKRFAEACACFQRAVAANSASAFIRGQFGLALLQTGNLADATCQFETALRIEPFQQLALAGLSLALRGQGDERYHALADCDQFLGVYEIDTPPDLVTELRSMHTTKIEPPNQTLRGGTQTLGSLFGKRSPSVQTLRSEFERKITDYIATMPNDRHHPVSARKSEKFRFTGSWSCLLKPAGYHTNHIHPKGWISSVFYADLPQAVSAGGREGWFKLGESNLSLGPQDAPERFVKPERGMLVLFPSYFWHGTVPFSGSDTRLTVAFDVVPEVRA